MRELRPLDQPITRDAVGIAGGERTRHIKPGADPASEPHAPGEILEPRRLATSRRPGAARSALADSQRLVRAVFDESRPRLAVPPNQRKPRALKPHCWRCAKLRARSLLQHENSNIIALIVRSSEPRTATGRSAALSGESDCAPDEMKRPPVTAAFRIQMTAFRV
jgi:hypothetical protein